MNKKLIVIYLNKTYAHQAHNQIVLYTCDHNLEFSDDFNYDTRFGDRLRNAENNYDFVAFVGDEEFEQDSVTIMNLKTCKQDLVNYWHIYDYLKKQ